MAMIKCRDCGKEISSRATACPYCGAPTRFGAREKENKASTTSFYLMIVLIAVGILMAVFAIGTIMTDRGYTYTAPFTNHEISVIIRLIFGVSLTSGGVAGMYTIFKNR